MKLISLKILSEFRNLNGLELKFNAQTNTYVLIGNNGAGKSSLLEAVSSVFYSLYQGGETRFEFNFTLTYDFEGHKVEISNLEETGVSLKVDDTIVDRAGIEPFMPQRVVCNYSGEEMRISERYYQPLWKQYESRLKDVTGFNPLRMVFVDKDLWRIIFYIIIAQRERYESFSAFLNDTIGVHSIDKIHFEIDRASLDLWRENTVSYYMRELAGRISPDGTLTLDQLNPNDDEALTMFNNLSSARSLISQLNITFNGNVDSQYLSEGEKKLMVVLFILEVISDERSLVLLDEPDSHLHVARKPQLVTMFKNAINRENVLTSHSPSLTAHFEDDSIIMLDRTADGHAQVVDTDKQRVVAKLTEGQWSLQQQNIFLESTDDIILVEGETDELFLKKALSVLQEQGHFLGKRYEYLPCGGAGGVELLKEHFQPKANQSIFCFFDSDQAGWKSINNIFGKTGNASYNSTNFQRARKSNNIWVAPYPKGKSRFTEFNIEDYLGRRILMRYVLRARSLNGIMTKDAIKRAMSRDCENGAINDKYFLRFAAVFQLIEDIKTADAAGSDVLV